MVVISVFFILIFFESAKVFSNALNTYCSLPCPFTGPAEPSISGGAIQLPARRPNIIARTAFYDVYTDYDETLEGSDPPPANSLSRRQDDPEPPPPTPPTTPSPPSKPKSKPSPERSEPPAKKNKCPALSSPSIQPSKKFFTSLFSIPGAVIDTLVGGEIVL